MTGFGLTDVIAGTGFSFSLPPTLLEGLPDSASVHVSLPGGMPMPAWLRFDQESRSFKASAVPDGALPKQVIVTIDGVRTVVVITERQGL